MSELSGITFAVLFVLPGLVAFGWWFNRQVERLGDDADGFTWLLVVIGCGVTLAGLGLLDLVLDWNAGLVGLLCFACSGFFMSAGAIRRYIAARRRLKDMARNDAAQALAE